jgi:hypothetical protein
MQDNDNTSGPSEETTTFTEVIDLSKYRKNKAEGIAQSQWPTGSPSPTPDTPLYVSQNDPTERRILISTVDGDIVMDGHLGLSQTFLAIGDAKGQIKFAAAPGKWTYCTDVTDNPKYQDDVA